VDNLRLAQCPENSLPDLLVFETDDGRTFAGADASFFLLCGFHGFSLKPLSVALPLAAFFADGEDSEPCAKCIR